MALRHVTAQVGRLNRVDGVDARHADLPVDECPCLWYVCSQFTNPDVYMFIEQSNQYMSKYYSKEGTCSECGEKCKLRYMVGVSQPLTTKCSDCRDVERKERIERVLGDHPDIWYRPDSEKYEIAVYKPNGDRRYYRHDLHAVQRIESWYEEE